MEFQKVKNVDASRGSFTHVVGNQYNITTNHTTAIHSAPSSHPQFLPALPVNNDGQVSVPIELQYRGKPTISGEILLDVKTGLGNLNDEEADVNEAVRIKLGRSHKNAMDYRHLCSKISVSLLFTWSRYIKAFLPTTM
jgi:hypothetical protein